VIQQREAPADEGAPGFFTRNRVPRLIAGIVITAVLVVAYAFGVTSYRAGLTQDMPEQQPPSGGVSVVVVPQRISAEDQEIPAQVLVFPSAELLDSAGLLTQELELRVQPAVSGQVLLLPAGEPPAPQAVMLPASGLVQQYPFDSYALSVDIHVHSLFADTYDALPVTTTLLFRVPGWSTQDTSIGASAGEGVFVSSDVVRDGSTKSIALLILLLMVILAAIAVLVTGSATRGRMKLELSVASWMTALLFALIPLRGFLPGDPPLGSWIDVLVFFWVELILMLSVAGVVTTILMRASDARHHPEASR
jgi:hypothetical protein